MDNESLIAALAFSVTVVAAAMAIITIVAHVIRAAKKAGQADRPRKI